MTKKLFKSGNIHGNAHVGYVSTISRATSNYASCYRDAAVQLTENIENSSGYNDHDACPIVFLFRHSIELYLKSIILPFIDFLGLKKANEAKISKIKKTLKTHKLNELLKHVEDAFLHFWSQLPPVDLLLSYGIESWDDVKTMISQLDRIDNNSQIFRYPIDKEGFLNKDSRLMFNILDFAREVDKICSFFESIEAPS